MMAMRFMISVRDSAPVSNIVEGGLDLFSVTEAVAVNETIASSLQITATPNPFNDYSQIHYDLSLLKSPAHLTVYDMLGHEMMNQELAALKGEIITGNNWPAGIYLLKITSDLGEKTMLLSKVK